MDWVASILGLYGMYLLANKNRYGWLLVALSNVVYGWLEWNVALYGMTAGSIVYIAIQLWGWYKHYDTN